MGQAIERQNKVASHLYIKENFPDMSKEQRGHMIRVQAGSPAFLRKGTYNPMFNNIFMFSNAMKEGWRGDLEVMKARPAEYAWKTVKYDIMPKMLMLAATHGFMGEDVKDIMDGVSDYDKTNYLIIPLGIDSNGKSVYFRVPQDETGRIFGGLFWKTINGQIKDTGQTYEDFVAYTGGQLPALSPLWTLISDTYSYFSGINPYDSFRQRPSINQTTWDAGGDYRSLAFVKHTSNQAGGPIIHRFNTNDLETIKTEIEELINFPVASNTIGRFLKVSDYGISQRLDKSAEKVIQKGAVASIIANKAINQMTIDPNYVLTDEDISALAAKSSSLDKRAQRILAQTYGNIFVKKILSARSNEERAAMFREIRIMAEEGNSQAREYLGIE